MKKTLSALLLSASVLLSLPACTTFPEAKNNTANRIAHPAFMDRRQIETGLFNLTVYERMHKRNAPADIYIEGDGLAWITRTQASLDPTPPYPVALHLAAMDKYQNVGYIARPCQYDGDHVFGNEKRAWNGEGVCPSKYWTSDRFSPEAVDAISKALDNMKSQYEITEFNLIGYSGGGAIAALLAAKRDDVASLRTVAGNLDHTAFTTLHNVTPMKGSLNPVDEAAKLRFVPQHHYIGGEDNVVPPAIFNSYAQALAPSKCNAHSFVPDVGHEYGWVEKWPELLKRPLGCSDRPKDAAPQPFTEPPQEFLDAGKEKGWSK